MSHTQLFKQLENIISIGRRLSEDDVYDCIEDPLEEATKAGKFPAHSIETGASKVCILIKGLNDVIKIPFSHYYNDDNRDDYLEELANDNVIPRDADGYPDDSNYELDDELFYYEFAGAYNDTLPARIDQDTDEEILCNWDYCALECAYYKEAVKAGVNQYFAEEHYFGCINGHPIYLQQRAIPFYDYKEIDWNDEKTSKKVNSAEETCQRLKCDCFNALWIADFIELYGEDEFLRLTQFLEKFKIDDLRTPNIGYLDDAPILFDYSGYNEDF